MKNKIIIGSRGSKLARIYAERAKEELLKNDKVEVVEIKTIKTTGDILTSVRLSEEGGKGMFCKKIEQELIDKKIDIAVHALKDMPTFETDGLITCCFLKRNNPREILISKNNKKINELRTSAVVGTSSYRREFQLRNIRDDLNYKLIRGNVDTRIRKLNENLYDAIILSHAGVTSLGLDEKISQTFSTSEIIPSAGQAVIALQCKNDNTNLIEILQKINHEETSICVQAEKDVLKILEGDCETAVGVFASIENNKINLEAELFSLDGKKRFYYQISKEFKLANDIGLQAGEILKKKSMNLYKK